MAHVRQPPPGPAHPDSSPNLGNFRLHTPSADYIDDELSEAIGDLIRRSVAQGAPLGWIDPPEVTETESLVRAIASALRTGDAALVVASRHTRAEGWSGTTSPRQTPETLLGFGYWHRYQRPTNRVHADVPLLVVDKTARGEGVGGGLLDALMATARASGIEQLTLDARGDNHAALDLWRSRGFQQYGTLADFVAVGDKRYDKTFWVADLR